MKQLTARQGWTHRYDDLAFWPAKALAWAWTTALTWQSRASRRTSIDSLDDRMLRDVGLTRRDIQKEIDKPFWKA